jgi:hypothetical protein
MPRNKGLRARNEDDDDLLDKREEHADENSDEKLDVVYGVCDWCDLEHYLASLPAPFDADLCRFCIKKQIKMLEYAHNKLVSVTDSSP